MHSGQGHIAFFLLRSAVFTALACSATPGLPASAQGPAPPSSGAHHAPAANTPAPPVHPIDEDQLRRQFQGKTVYLRGAYLDDDLHFDQAGRLLSSSPRTSFTLSMVEIDKVRVSKHKVQFEGIRFGLHFLGGNPNDGPLSSSDKVRITPRKKIVRISIDRAEVVKPQKEKKHKEPPPGSPTPQQTSPAHETSDGFVMTQARANQMLSDALDRVFAPALDDKMVASMPDFWQSYYKAIAAKSEFKPASASVLRQNTVDQKARLLTIFQPDSNDFAQKAGVAGVALYHVVVGPDGKPGEIAVGRPIGFGLDENAVASIRKASFQPAVKDGKPVPVLLDLLVEFRIYSQRTGAPSTGEAASATTNEPQSSTPLPGPYTANEPPTRQQ